MSRKRKRATKKREQGKRDETPTNQATLLQQALGWFLDKGIFADLSVHGNATWVPVELVTLACLWAWSDSSKLTTAYTQASQLAAESFGIKVFKSYQGFIRVLVGYSDPLLAMFWQHLHQRMEQIAGKHWRVGLWLTLAVDGSRITTPRTRENEQRFAAKKYGKGKMAKSRKKWKNKRHRSKPLGTPVKPQIWLTLIWHVGLKLPWCWRTGPSDASERKHLLEMLDSHEFPENTLFCGDAGFVGYEFWNAIQKHRHHFLVRVGANVRLLKNLGVARQRGDIVYLWPDAIAKKKLPPLVLRLISFQGARGPVFLVTNVLSEGKLSVRQAAQIYRLRWGIELQFRCLKQTFGRTKLSSRTPDNALAELNWSLVGLTLVQLFAVKEQIKIDSPPENCSVALALDVFRDAMHNWSKDVEDRREFFRRLQEATKDQYQRRSSKRARYRPDYKDKPTATAPVIVNATEKQRRKYQSLNIAV